MFEDVIEIAKDMVQLPDDQYIDLKQELLTMNKGNDRRLAFLDVVFGAVEDHRPEFAAR